jgi:flagellar capping protein FliD
MNAVSRGIVTAAVLGILPGVAAAQLSVTQTVQYQVNAINVIAFFGSPTLTVSTAVPGSDLTPTTSTGSTWAVTTNQSNSKITAVINSSMPAGLTLTANLDAPSGATSTGEQTLSTTAQDMVTGITRVAEAALNVIYGLTATVSAGVTSGTRIVTYTITGGV